ncbi:hypothetical protein AVEN_131298-1 [Araneus ventricosus]|uniref:Uncharacterized protein n=1 Tax=Araneus ventricosus TaxID=182803 RepID=A0A4Y2HF57_ARAVE|nr:hypothetical protein AVEN_131298-1 [Araneus ventricosus]
MCPEKCVTPHSGSVAGRTDSPYSKRACNKGLKEGPPASGQALTGFNGPTSLTFVGKFVTTTESFGVKFHQKYKWDQKRPNHTA